MKLFFLMSDTTVEIHNAQIYRLLKTGSSLRIHSLISPRLGFYNTTGYLSTPRRIQAAIHSTIACICSVYLWASGVISYTVSLVIKNCQHV